MKKLGTAISGGLIVELAVEDLNLFDQAMLRLHAIFGLPILPISSGAPAAPAAATPPPNARRGRSPGKSTDKVSGRPGAKGKAPGAPARRKCDDCPTLLPAGSHAKRCPPCIKAKAARDAAARYAANHPKAKRISAAPAEKTPPPSEPASASGRAMRIKALAEAKELERDRTNFN